MTFGERMLALMGEREVSLRRLAKQVPCDVGFLSKVSHDLKGPSAQIAARLDEILGADGELAALRRPARRPRTADSVEATTVRVLAHDWDEMERRTLLQLAALGIGGGVLASGPLSALVDVALTSEPRDLNDWHLACDDHLHGIRTRPPALVRQDLVIDLLALGRQISRAKDAELIELRRVEAALATLHANILTRLGDHGSAIRWWRTAHAAAKASGDLDLQLGIYATEAGHGLMGQRDPATVFRLTQQAQGIAGGSRSLGVALVACSQAKALSVLGRHDEARRTLNTSAELFAVAVEPKGIMAGYWQGGQLAAAEHMVYAAAGDEFAMAQTRARLRLQWNDDYEIPARLQMNEGLCSVVNGGVSEGVQRAAEALDSVPPGLRNSHITHAARTVLRAVPLDQHDRPAVRELRALTSGAPSALT